MHRISNLLPNNWLITLDTLKTVKAFNGPAKLLAIQEEIEARKLWDRFTTEPRPFQGLSSYIGGGLFNSDFEENQFEPLLASTDESHFASLNAENTALSPTKIAVNRLTELRTIHRMPKRKLAQLAGISCPTLIKAEARTRKPSDSTLEKLAAVFDITLLDLISPTISDDLNHALTSPFASAEEVSSRIKIFRKRHRLSQTEFAERAGVSSVYVSEVERGLYQPKKEFLKKIATAMGITPPSALIAREPSKALRVALKPVYLDPKEFGRRIRALRKATGLTMIEFAKQAGFSQQATISGLELGRSNPTDETLQKLANQFELEPEDLILIEESDSLKEALIPTLADTETLSRRLTVLRKARGLNVTRMAEETGISLITIINIERKNQQPRAKTIKKLADFFGLSVEELTSWNKSPKLKEMMASSQVRNLMGHIAKKNECDATFTDDYSKQAQALEETLLEMHTHRMADTHFGEAMNKVMATYILEAIQSGIDLETILETSQELCDQTSHIFEYGNSPLTRVYVEFFLSLFLVAKVLFSLRASIMDDILCRPIERLVESYFEETLLDYHTLAVITLI